jgi:hypothetical protein
MKHLRKFEKYTNLRKKDQIIKESVLQVNDIYKVRTFIDIPQSLINAYVKKVKDTTGKNLRQFFGDVDIAEEVVKYINTNFLNVDQIPAGALMGDAQSQGETQTDSQAQPAQAQAQPAQAQPAQAQAQPAQAQAQPAQAQAQTQDQAQAQSVQAQPQAQPQAEAQPQVQVQAESQPQGQGEFEEVDEEGEEEKEEGTEEGGEELPL